MDASMHRKAFLIPLVVMVLANVAAVSQSSQHLAAEWLVGREAPIVSGTDAAGRDVSLGRLPKPLVVAFLSTDCPYCRELRPQLEQLAEGFPVVIVLSGHDDAPSPSADTPTLWVLRDMQSAIGEIWGGRAVPTLALVDISGRLSWLGEGYDEAVTAVRQIAGGMTPALQVASGAALASSTACKNDSECAYLTRHVNENECVSNVFSFDDDSADPNYGSYYVNDPKGWQLFLHNGELAGWADGRRYTWTQTTGYDEIYHCIAGQCMKWKEDSSRYEVGCQWGCDVGATEQCMCQVTTNRMSCDPTNERHILTEKNSGIKNAEGKCETYTELEFICPRGWTCTPSGTAATCVAKYFSYGNGTTLASHSSVPSD